MEVTPNPNPHRTLRNRIRYPLTEKRFRENKAVLGVKVAGVKAALTAQPENKLQCTYP